MKIQRNETEANGVWAAFGALMIAIAASACGGALAGVHGSDCPRGQTILDGTCVTQQIADYVACIRATGATVASNSAKELSAKAGLAGVTAATQAEVQDRLEKSYEKVSDDNVKTIIVDCNAKTASRNQPPTANPGPRAEPDVATRNVRDAQGSTLSMPAEAPSCREGDAADCAAKCEARDARSCLTLGLMSLKGEGVPKDEARAAGLLEQACTAGALQGCGRLGLLYSRGEGVARDPARAVMLYQRACDGGGLVACTNLGTAYVSGDGANRDPGRAATLFKFACDRGFPLACSDLGVRYLRGEGVERDPARAVTLFELACDRGVGLACSHLGELYANGRVVAKDEGKAATLLKQGCTTNEPLGCYYGMGLMYESGIGVAPDRARALGLYRQSCNAGYGASCDRLRRIGESP